MSFKSIVITLACATAVIAGDCNPNDPYGQECVNVYGNANCDAGSQKTSYKPTCKGNCYVYPFNSLNVQGSYLYGTNCVAYSDKECKNKIGESGNIVGQGNGKCANFSGGQSMKCYYKC
ncbi:hypothetical protein VHEMI03226 [[Torrubiella] hemipterigena]|uniref:Secreted protein n=1 Tax=[Torrubiella] hemipterigena TaxID=1531966 RepID=A0A0A1SXZ6_9HYPO|nr:hypothetical protein VHEMI03226 [[Torrubiella] hemipterigena]